MNPLITLSLALSKRLSMYNPLNNPLRFTLVEGLFICDYVIM